MSIWYLKPPENSISRPQSHIFVGAQICVMSSASLFAGIPVKYSCSTSYVEIDMWGYSGNVWTTGSSNFGQVAEKCLQVEINTFKWNFALKCETPLFEPLGLTFDQMKALRLRTGVQHVGWPHTTGNWSCKPQNCEKCELHFSSQNVRLTWRQLETWKPISVGAHTLQKFCLIYNEAVYRMKCRSDI